MDYRRRKQVEQVALQIASHPAVQQLEAGALQLGISCAAYNSTLAVCHVAAGCARISCATPLLGPLWGFASVALASAAAGHVSRASLAALQHSERRREGLLGALRLLPGQLGRAWDAQEVALDMALGPAVFKLLCRHEFRRLLPSHLAKPGAFGSMHIPTGPTEYSTATEKAQLSVIFGRYGCHTCGSLRNGVIGDHQPPYKIVKDALAAREAARTSLNLEGLLVRVADFLCLKDPALKQVYFAQCKDCSALQAQLMRCGTRTTRLPGLWPPELVVARPVRLATRPALPGLLVGFRYYVAAAVQQGPAAGGGKDGGGRDGEAGGRKEAGVKHKQQQQQQQQQRWWSRRVVAWVPEAGEGLAQRRHSQGGAGGRPPAEAAALPRRAEEPGCRAVGGQVADIFAHCRSLELC
ncbi:hypothetical protein GPECTOR_11g326 [Gonium pectorale]|uniref:Uncharacterized protein n=1 Tax=Gonium pectorale TaxID=33097 RepID=A0A150GQ73_GONPE|nr:hypothetical protein GPECTOR_11g326 [Gonium pectorale]|eukprot:KXZ51892.1 hypothetical protein GPECTOR_11g326 [Gonium pectorale]